MVWLSGGLTAIPKGRVPTGMVLSPTLLVLVSMVDTDPDEAFTTYAVVPSDVTATCVGREPSDTVVTTVPVEVLITVTVPSDI
jgi:hypothetical protein